MNEESWKESGRVYKQRSGEQRGGAYNIERRLWPARTFHKEGCVSHFNGGTGPYWWGVQKCLCWQYNPPQVRERGVVCPSRRHVSHLGRKLLASAHTQIPILDPWCHCRYVPMFGEVQYRQERAYTSIPLEEQLEAVSKAVRQGKVRRFGVSNETPWGLMQFLHLCMALWCPPLSSIGSFVVPSSFLHC